MWAMYSIALRGKSPAVAIDTWRNDWKDRSQVENIYCISKHVFLPVKEHDDKSKARTLFSRLLQSIARVKPLFFCKWTDLFVSSRM